MSNLAQRAGAAIQTIEEAAARVDQFKVSNSYLTEQQSRDEFISKNAIATLAQAQNGDANLVIDAAVLKSLLQGYAASDHSHSNYSQTGHGHEIGNVNGLAEALANAGLDLTKETVLFSGGAATPFTSSVHSGGNLDAGIYRLDYSQYINSSGIYSAIFILGSARPGFVYITPSAYPTNTKVASISPDGTIYIESHTDSGIYNYFVRKLSRLG